MSIVGFFFFLKEREWEGKELPDRIDWKFNLTSSGLVTWKWKQNQTKNQQLSAEIEKVIYVYGEGCLLFGFFCVSAVLMGSFLEWQWEEGYKQSLNTDGAWSFGNK